MHPLRVGVIGYGYTGKLHVQAYLAQGGVQLAAVADSQDARLHDLPPGVRGYPGYQDLIESDVEAVSICLPTHLHAQIAIEALERGKHVLVEKPIAVDLEEAHRMLDAARTAGRILYVGMTHRFYPELREAKKLIDDGAIGSIVACNDCAFEHLGFLDLPAWYLQKKYAGGGAALTSGIHLVDRLLWFTGDEVTAVAGTAGNPYFNADVEDSGQIFLRFRSGISALVNVAFMSEPHPIVCDLQILGSRGSITVHTWRGYEVWNKSGRREKVIYTGEAHRDKVLVGMAGEIGEFCASIAEGRTPWPSAEESTRALGVIMAYYQAAASGQTVELGDPDAF